MAFPLRPSNAPQPRDEGSYQCRSGCWLEIAKAIIKFNFNVINLVIFLPLFAWRSMTSSANQIARHSSKSQTPRAERVKTAALCSPSENSKVIANHPFPISVGPMASKLSSHDDSIISAKPFKSRTDKQFWKIVAAARVVATLWGESRRRYTAFSIRNVWILWIEVSSCFVWNEKSRACARVRARSLALCVCLCTDEIEQKNKYKIKRETRTAQMFVNYMLNLLFNMRHKHNDNNRNRNIPQQYHSVSNPI